MVWMLYTLKRVGVLKLDCRFLQPAFQTSPNTAFGSTSLGTYQPEGNSAAFLDNSSMNSPGTLQYSEDFVTRSDLGWVTSNARVGEGSLRHDRKKVFCK